MERPRWHHTDDVNSAHFSPDGAKIVTASDDFTPKIWMFSMALLSEKLQHSSIVYRAQFSPSGTKIATASADGTAKLWNVSDGFAIHTLRGHTHPVYSAQFSPDGTKIITASSTTKLWQRTTPSFTQLVALSPLHTYGSDRPAGLFREAENLAKKNNIYFLDALIQLINAKTAKPT